MIAHTMRTACRRGCGTDGYIETKNGQDCVYCAVCHSYAGYNAPKSETGRQTRSVTKCRNGIKPGKRARVLERDNCRCVMCGSKENLHVGHLLSVDVGRKIGLNDDELDNEENLAAMCDECNLGQAERPVSLRLLMAILKARIMLQEPRDDS